MIKVSKLEKYGIELVEDDHTLQVFGHKVVIGFAARDINTLDRASIRDIYVSVRNAHTCTSIDEINSDDVVIGLWTHWRPSMQWLVQQELAGCKDDSEYFGESIPSGIPTETPEEKLALDAIEKKSPYDVGAHCSGLNKPVYTQAMRDAGELPPVGSEYLDEDGQLCRCVGYSSEKGFVIGQMVEHPSSHGYPPISTAAKSCIKPIQTEQDKVIFDLMFHVDQTITISQAKAIVDAGYTK